MPPLKIDAGDLLLAMEDHSETVSYLDLQTGEVIPVFDDMFEPDDPEYVDAEAMHGDPRYLVIEPIESHEGYRWMEDFADQVADARLREKLYAALDGSRPFRRFKDVLAGYPEEREAWFRFEEARVLEAAREWLRASGVDAELVNTGPPAGAEPQPRPMA